MMQKHRSYSKTCWATVALITIASSGCNPVSTTVQSVQFRVTNQRTDQPVDNATVILNWKTENLVRNLTGKAQPKGAIHTLFIVEDKSTGSFPKHPNPPKYCGITDTNGVGIAHIFITNTTKDVTKRPPDELTGARIECTVYDKKTVGTKTIVVEKGRRTPIKYLNVEILDIGPPLYVKHTW